MNNEELNQSEKKNRIFDFTLLITSLICLVPMLVGIILWDKLPETMVRHMNIEMEANGWSSKTTFVYIFPLILIGINLFVNLSINISRKTHKTELSKMDKLIKYILPVFSALIFIILELMNLGSESFSPENTWTLVSLACVLLFLGIGNYIPKAKDLTGISLPGIVEIFENDKDLWFRVRRTWSRVIIFISIPMIVTSFLPFIVSIIFFFIWLLIFVFTPYILVAVYKKKSN